MNPSAPQQSQAQTQAHFDFIVGISRELLRVDEVATRLGRSHDYVHDLIAEGQLEHHRRGVTGSSLLITRRSLIAWLARTAAYQPEDFINTIVDLAKTLGRKDRLELLKRLQALPMPPR